MDIKPPSFAASKLAVTVWLMALSVGHAQTGVEAWVRRYSHSASASAYGSKIATDSGGNVIVAGYMDDHINGEDFLIIKYSGAGVALWTNRYNGPGTGNDEVTRLGVDSSGNVFVAGSSYGSASNLDYATIKYSSAGVPLWTNRYNGPGNNDDRPTGLAVDAGGNVIVTGGNYGYATIKYSSGGTALWTNLYNSLIHIYDSAAALAVDGNGNVFVTGTSYNGASYDYATVAYTAAGTALWTNVYNGPANGDDHAYAVAVDNGGNVFVTGSSEGNGTRSDYATIKYSSAGVPLWTNRYGGPVNGGDVALAVAVDSNGNAFVTGYSYNGSADDYVTVAYSGAGTALWTNVCDGPGQYGAIATTALAVDSSGNVSVTGISAGVGNDYATVKYSGAGVALWTNRYNGPANSADNVRAIAVDGSGNVFVTGESYTGAFYESATLACSGAGSPLWTNRYNAPGNGNDYATAVAVDGAGNVLVTGYSAGSAGPYAYEYATLRYSSAGVPLWTNRYHGPGNSAQAQALAVDGSGNVFVTGYVVGASSNYDYATIKYSSAGTPLWTNLYNGPADNSDTAVAMAVDRNGNVFVTGSSYKGANDYDYATVAYSGAGTPLWTNLYDGPGHDEDHAYAVAVDSSGNVFVTGSSVASGFDSDYATIKYSGAGVPLWTNRYPGPGGYSDYAQAVAADGGGNVFVTGGSIGSGGNPEYATIKYSSTGTPLWTNRYSGPVQFSEGANALVLDSNGDLVVTGNSSGSYATIKYSSAGTALWTNRYAGSANSYAVGVDGNRDVFVTGYSKTGSSYDYVTIAYSSTGSPLWTNRYNGPANGDDQPQSKSCLAVGPDGSVYVTGASDGDYTSSTTYDYATIKYSIGNPRLAIAPDGGAGYFLRFQGVGGTAYELQRAPSVNGPWAGGTSQTSSASGLLEFRDTSPPPGQAFYRVRVE